MCQGGTHPPRLAQGPPHLGVGSADTPSTILTKLRAPRPAIGRASWHRRPVPPSAAGSARCGQWGPLLSPPSHPRQPMVAALGSSWLFRGKKDLARKSGRDFAGSGGRGRSGIRSGIKPSLRPAAMGPRRRRRLPPGPGGP